MRRLLPILLLLSACEPPPPPIPGELSRTGEVLEVVNGKNVTQGMVDVTLSQLPANVRDQVVARGQMAQFKDQVVVAELLYQEAVKQKIHERAEVKDKLAFAERTALANELLEDVVKQRSTDEAVKTYYNDHAVQYQRPQIKARLILLKDKAEADAIMKELQGGGDFAKIASEKSLHKPSAKDGGEIGWVETNRLGPEVVEKAKTANAGDVIGPIESQGGVQILKVEEKREATPVEEVADQIKQSLRNEIAQAYIDELKKAATITTPNAPAGGSATVAPSAVETESKAADPAAAPK